MNEKNLHFLRKKLSSIMKNMSEVFLDTETTGLSFKDGHKIVEIACVETKDLIPTGKVFHKLINPKEAYLMKHLKFMDFQKSF